jgi:septal ring factor EnvC (AmiA/AmiB activator)
MAYAENTSTEQVSDMPTKTILGGEEYVNSNYTAISSYLDAVDDQRDSTINAINELQANNELTQERQDKLLELSQQAATSTSLTEQQSISERVKTIADTVKVEAQVKAHDQQVREQEEAARKAAEEAEAKAKAEAEAAEAKAKAEAAKTSSSTSTSTSYTTSSSTSNFKQAGVLYDSQYRYTYYSSKVLHHYKTSQWTAGSDGIYRDSNGRVIVASDTYAQGTVINTELFGECVVEDCGVGRSDTLDVYVNF